MVARATFKPLMPLTLRWRLTLLYTALMAFLLAVISVSVYAALRNNLYDNLNRELDRTLEQLQLKSLEQGFPILSDFDPNGFSQVDQVFDATLSRDAVSFGVPFRNASLLRIDARIRLGDAAYEQLDRTENYRGETALTVGDLKLPILVQARYLRSVQTQLGAYPLVLYTARDMSGLRATLSDLRAILLLLSLAGLAAAAIGSYSVAAGALEPIRKVRDTAAEITGKSLNTRVPEPNTHDEVGDLARTLNGMLERLENSFETQKRFTADASHELRTPVTAILGHANFLLRRTNPTADQKESLDAIRALSNRLSKLIADLLDLARADAGLPIQAQEVNLVSLAEDVHLELAAIAGSTEIEVGGARNLIVMADPNRTKQVILNLVQNAIKAGSTRVRVNVELEKGTEKSVLLSIEDNGPGIPADHLTKLFDRFYRVDTARDRAVGGSGLGLSIVKWIVEAHGGTVQVSSKVGVGTRFDVRLPLLRVVKPVGVAVNVLDDRA
jgi:heavy metal sensor kinase